MYLPKLYFQTSASDHVCFGDFSELETVFESALFAFSLDSPLQITFNIIILIIIDISGTKLSDSVTSTLSCTLGM
jgi:hypothetical protein